MGVRTRRWRRWPVGVTGGISWSARSRTASRSWGGTNWWHASIGRGCIIARWMPSLWFIASVRLHWSGEHPRDQRLAQELEVEQLPALSVANVRELLVAVIPLPRLTPEEAIQLVIQHLCHRARSTRSRLK